MGRAKRSDREFDLLGRMKIENSKLKRENSRLRKIIDRFDVRNHILTTSEEEPESNPSPSSIWRCYNCDAGTLILKVLDRRDSRIYNRVCDNPECGKRTKFQKWTKDIK